MTHRQSLVTYVDCRILDILTADRFEDDAIRQERIVLENIWQHFKEDRIRLVTCDEEMKQDIIIGLNGLACCVTDTIHITDNIDEFEKWNQVDRQEIKRWRQVIDLCDQLEYLGNYEDYLEGTRKRTSTLHPDNDVSMLLKNDVLGSESPEDYHAKYCDEDVAILQDCVNDLGNWYGEDAWRKLRRVEYNLNWKILKKALRAHSLEPVLRGESAARNKYLLGLLNRVVGFGKKSCSRLPLEPGHVLFIIDTVIKKYYHPQDRRSPHIMKCIEHGVDHFLSVDEALIDRFNQRKGLLLSHPYCRNSKLELIRPVELLRLISIQQTTSY